MGLIGHNPEYIAVALKNINIAYNELVNILVDQTQRYVNSMQDCWTGDAALEFFYQKFKPSIDSLISSVNRTYEDINKLLNNIVSSHEFLADQIKKSFEIR